MAYEDYFKEPRPMRRHTTQPPPHINADGLSWRDFAEIIHAAAGGFADIGPSGWKLMRGFWKEGQDPRKMALWLGVVPWYRRLWWKLTA